MERRRPRCGSTSFAIAVGKETSRKLSGRRWERRRAGKRADANMCRTLSCFPSESATKRWWTSWQLMRSGSSRQNEWRHGMEQVQRPTQVRGVAAVGFIFTLFFFFSFLLVSSGISLNSQLSILNFCFSFDLSAEMQGSGGGGSSAI